MKSKSVKFLRINAIILLTGLFSLALTGQTVRDIDGKTYKTIRIGTKEWMGQNLDVSRFRNGDSIPQAKTPEEWKQAGLNGKPAWCRYENNDSIGAIYGKLYNWFATTDPRGLAPEGWHVPTSTDWTSTTKFLGGVDVAGIKYKSTTVWTGRNAGSNKSGFSALPGGARSEEGKFSDVGHLGQWWSVSGKVGAPNLIYSFKLQDFYVEVFYETREKGAGLSVRAVKD